VELWPFLPCTRLDWQDWNCIDELRLRFANGAWLVLATDKSCLRAREKLERREEEGIRDLDIVGPIAGQIDGRSMLIIQKVYIWDLKWFSLLFVL
jgi:hypothetical protein